MSQVFSQPAMDTPALSPGWTVQNSATGSNQSLTASSGAGVNTGTSIGYVSEAAPASIPTDGTATNAQMATAIMGVINALKTGGPLH